MKKDRLKEAFSKFIEQTYKYCIFGIFVCWFMKLFGIDWFGLDLDNKFFRDLDLLFKNNIWIKEIYSTVTLNVILYFLTCSVTRKQGKEVWIYLLKLLPLTIVYKVITTQFLDVLGNLSALLDILYLVFSTSMFNFRKYFKALVQVFAYTLYQFISLQTRSLELQAHSYGFIATQLLSIDLYLMLYLHKEVEVRRMGDGTWVFFGLTAWIYGVAGAIVGIFKAHPIKTAKEWYARGKEKENARKTEKELKKNRGK